MYYTYPENVTLTLSPPQGASSTRSFKKNHETVKHPGQCRKVRTYGGTDKRTKPHVDPGAPDKNLRSQEG